MNLQDVTVLILTFNEAPNIRRCLKRLFWASDVLVVDSGSTDETLSICDEFSNVRIVHRAFDSFASQCNFGLSLVTTEWVLSLDADYLVGEVFADTLQRISPEADGYSAQFRYVVYGYRLRASLYPPRTVLYRTAKAHYEDVGHSHRVRINGTVSPLGSSIDHDDRKPLDRWLNAQRRYATSEADHLLTAQSTTLGSADRIRKRIWIAVPAVFFYVLILKRCLLDGWPGLHYAFQRAYAELLLSLELLDRRLRMNESAVGSRQLTEKRKESRE